MKTLKFKTTLKCGGCIAKVKEQLDAVKEIKSWNVDLANPDRLLTIETESDVTAAIIKIFNATGYKAEPFS